MKVVKGVRQWQEIRGGLGERRLGFVPTMGALHEGHLSLIARSRSENELTVASIFVNPTQFDDPKDLERYPRTLERDLELLEAAGCDFVLLPEPSELYHDDYRYRVSERELSTSLCGAHRPGHFDGVLTVVLKLLQLARARRAYFGEKDYQQYLLIKGMAEAFFLETEIIGCRTVREEDGLAMSSRNRLLSASDRERARSFPVVLRSGELPPESVRGELERLGFEVDYIEDRVLFGRRRRFGAVRVGSVRLIDNLEFDGGEK
jgi:pantoate--beta-alanine ligase